MGWNTPFGQYSQLFEDRHDLDRVRIFHHNVQFKLTPFGKLILLLSSISMTEFNSIFSLKQQGIIFKASF